MRSCRDLAFTNLLGQVLEKLLGVLDVMESKNALEDLWRQSVDNLGLKPRRRGSYSLVLVWRPVDHFDDRLRELHAGQRGASCSNAEGLHTCEGLLLYGRDVGGRMLARQWD